MQPIAFWRYSAPIMRAIRLWRVAAPYPPYLTTSKRTKPNTTGTTYCDTFIHIVALCIIMCANIGKNIPGRTILATRHSKGCIAHTSCSVRRGAVCICARLGPRVADIGLLRRQSHAGCEDDIICVRTCHMSMSMMIHTMRAYENVRLSCIVQPKAAIAASATAPKTKLLNALPAIVHKSSWSQP